MAAPVFPQPDLEAHLWDQIRHLPGVTSFCYAASPDHLGWVVASNVQIDARAKTKEAASDLAEQARQSVMRLPDAPWAEGVVCYVQGVEGPFWLPDPDGGPRYCARYEIRAHPARTAA